eukprot:gene7730-biopygen16577
MIVRGRDVLVRGRDTTLEGWHMILDGRDVGLCDRDAILRHDVMSRVRDITSHVPTLQIRVPATYNHAPTTQITSRPPGSLSKSQEDPQNIYKMTPGGASLFLPGTGERALCAVVSRKVARAWLRRGLVSLARSNAAGVAVGMLGRAGHQGRAVFWGLLDETAGFPGQTLGWNTAAGNTAPKQQTCVREPALHPSGVPFASAPLSLVPPPGAAVRATLAGPAGRGRSPAGRPSQGRPSRAAGAARPGYGAGKGAGWSPAPVAGCQSSWPYR